MLDPTINSRHRAPSAFTLVELLVVMGIITLVAAFTLPNIKGLLKDQKITQGVRQIKAYAESAKARAIATGRPVALIIERMKLDNSGASADAATNDTSARLSIGEVFPPYAGDWAGTTATISQHPTIAGVQIASIALAQAASIASQTGIVDVDDVIQFGDSPQTYRITGVVVNAPTDVQILFQNPPFDPITTLPTGEATLFPVAPMSTPPASLPLTFRIFRKPSKSLVGNITLPRGICIDLSVSGIGRSGREFGAESISGAMPSPAGYYGPIYIVFNPVGSVQDLYYATAPNNRTLDTVRHPVGGMIHLLVGKTEQVFSNPAGDLSNNLPGYLSNTVILPPSGPRDDLTYNILDSSNYWLTINPFSGAIYSSQVQQLNNSATGPLADARIAEARALAIAGVQSTNP